MILRAHDGKAFTVQFQHYFDLNLDLQEPEGRHTYCRIYEGIPSPNNAKRLGEGFAFVHPKDNPTRVMGRKVSFTRALRQAFPDRVNREYRASLWRDLLKQTKIVE